MPITPPSFNILIKSSGLAEFYEFPDGVKVNLRSKGGPATSWDLVTGLHSGLRFNNYKNQFYGTDESTRRHQTTLGHGR